MSRATSAVSRKARHKKMLKLAKGFTGSRSKIWTVVKEIVEKSLCQAYVGRKLKKRQNRSLWILRLNAALHNMNLKYSTFINLLKQKNIKLNRKILASICEDRQVLEAIINDK